MGFFDSILPPQGQAQAPTPELPPSLLALLKGTPVAQHAAQEINSAPSPLGTGNGTPGAAPLGTGSGPSYAAPLGGPPTDPGPRPILGKNIPAPGSALPLPSAREAGFAAAAEGAAHAQTFDSPLTTLASSVLEAIRKGAPAFRAQRQANKETQYVADLQSAQEKSYRDFVNEDKNFASDPVHGKSLQAALKGMSSEKGQALLGNAQMWEPKITAFGEGGLFDERTQKVLREPTKKDVVYREGDAIQAKDPKTGEPQTNPDGTPKMIYPAGEKPVKRDVDETSPEWKAAKLALFGQVDPQKLDQKMLAAIDAKVLGDKARIARAGAPPLEDKFITALGAKNIEETATRATAAQQSNSVLPALYDARDLVKAGKVNTGIFGDAKQLVARITGDASAENTQTAAAELLGTIIPQLKGTGIGRLTNNEIDILKKSVGADFSVDRGAVERMVNGVISRLQGQVTDHNTRLGGLARAHPSVAGDLVSQYGIPMADDPTSHKTPQQGSVYPNPASPTGYVVMGPDGKFVPALPPGGGGHP